MSTQISFTSTRSFWAIQRGRNPTLSPRGSIESPVSHRQTVGTVVCLFASMQAISWTTRTLTSVSLIFQTCARGWRIASPADDSQVSAWSRLGINALCLASSHGFNCTASSASSLGAHVPWGRAGWHATLNATRLPPSSLPPSPHSTAGPGVGSCAGRCVQESWPVGSLPPVHAIQKAGCTPAQPALATWNCEKRDCELTPAPHLSLSRRARASARPEGRSGRSGRSGPVGPEGRSGRSGRSGPVGPEGRSGRSGPEGRSGRSSPESRLGQEGRSGPDPEGCSGPKGRSGRSGSSGPDPEGRAPRAPRGPRALGALGPERAWGPSGPRAARALGARTHTRGRVWGSLGSLVLDWGPLGPREVCTYKQLTARKRTGCLTLRISHDKWDTKHDTNHEFISSN